MGVLWSSSLLFVARCLPWTTWKACHNAFCNTIPKIFSRNFAIWVYGILCNPRVNNGLVKKVETEAKVEPKLRPPVRLARQYKCVYRHHPYKRYILLQLTDMGMKFFRLWKFLFLRSSGSFRTGVGFTLPRWNMNNGVKLVAGWRVLLNYNGSVIGYSNKFGVWILH